MGPSGESSSIPRPIRDCIAYLRSTGLTDEGLFRRSPSSVLLRQVQDAYDRGQPGVERYLESYGDPHLAAVLIKKFLRSLPEPIFGESMYSVIRKCPDMESDPEGAVEYVREFVIGGLPGNAQVLLNIVIR